MTRFAWLCLAAVSVVTTAGADDSTTTAQDDAPAIVKLGDLNDTVVRGQCDDGSCDLCPADCAGEGCDGSCGGDCSCCNGSCGNCGDGSCGNGKCRPEHGHLKSWWKGQSSLHQARNRHNSNVFAHYMKSKFGYFCPTGNCGKGVPLWGKYNLVYAQNPGYTDPRNAYTYAAPGYGTPVNVPLAPNVRHTYNYGWGVPSSRLTPIRQAQVVGPPQPAVHHAPTWHR